MRQLELIREVLEVADGNGIQVWLRGGWAMDFFLGEVTREHEDIDFFAWAAEAPALALRLAQQGFRPLTGPPLDQQRDFVKDGEEVSVALVHRSPAGAIAVAGGPWAGTPFPQAAPHHLPGRIGDLVCPVVNPRGQIEIKQMMPEWNPRLRRRPKDLADIARLAAAVGENRSPAG